MKILTALLLSIGLAGGAQAACGLPPGGMSLIQDVIQRTNVFRTTKLRKKVTFNPALQEAAQAHACWMARKRTMSHQGRGGSSVGERAKAEGYRWGFIAENIAMGQPTSKMVFQDWKQSPGHRQNMLARDAHEIGIGVAMAGGRLYWAMVLGKPLTYSY